MKFPQADGAHHCDIEWWYFNGFLKAQNFNEQYGFSLAFFKLRKVNSHILRNTLFNYEFQLHFSLVDMTKKEYLSDVRYFGYSPWKTSLSCKQLKHRTEGCSFEMDSNERLDLMLDLNQYKLNLKLVGADQLMVHGDEGVIEMTNHLVSSYYSRPNLSGQGLVVIDQKKIDVDSSVWMDHQWGNWEHDCAYWTWISVQLDDGMRGMFFYIHDKRGGDVQHYVSILNSDGREERFKNFQIQKIRTYKSKETGVEYPIELKVDLKDMSFNIKAVMEHQDIQSQTASYWEGACFVEARIGGERVLGKAYVEIVGRYA